MVLDVGTNNVELRNDPKYLGLKRPRITGQAYYDIVDEVCVLGLLSWDLLGFMLIKGLRERGLNRGIEFIAIRTVKSKTEYPRYPAVPIC